MKVRIETAALVFDYNLYIIKMLMNVSASILVIKSAQILKDLSSAAVILVFSYKILHIHVKVMVDVAFTESL